ncbi:Fc receptor-like protein 5 [Cyprinodon tularosa]|uniref:Fc receptor-like protein 5 n=1 Tax=Cyprinodon tularosa TaxID=77115 RepID=UPI0018E26947|nr:Fc receptor-like protein 5 [Cyprinodon tularosa]
MGHPLLCMLGFFLTFTLHCDYAQGDKSRATLRADKTTIPLGRSVRLTCSVDGSADWNFYWFRNWQRYSVDQTRRNIDPYGVISISEGGLYSCRGGRGDPVFTTETSNEISIWKTVFKPTVIQQTSGSDVYSGEKVTLRCKIYGGGGTQWTYEWSPTNRNSPTSSEYRIITATESGGTYRCRARGDYQITDWSDALTLTVRTDKPRATLRADKSLIPLGGTVRLTCSVDGSADWNFYWFRNGQQLSVVQTRRNIDPYGVISISEGGLYSCIGGRGYPVFTTETSNKISIWKTVSKPTVILQPNWPQIFRGEKVTLRCEIHGGGGAQWTYEWRPTNRNSPASSEHRINTATESGDRYWCKARGDYQITAWSDAFRLTVKADKPTASLIADQRIIPLGGSITLTCSVSSSNGWKFDWFRNGKQYSVVQTRGNIEPYGDISISEGGLYSCRGGRGDPVFYTEDSSKVTIYKTVPVITTVIQQPNWSQIFRGETVTLRCEIHGGGGAQWTYEWRTTSRNSPTSSEYRINKATESYSGEYRCRGRRDVFSITEWGVLMLNVSDKAQPVLSVSPSWLSPGASVTLSCGGLEHLSAGWRFFWYKVVPAKSSSSYSFEPLTGRTNWTEQNSYLINGQNHTAGYVCRARRGEPVFYTEYSEPKFVWSADSHPAASLSVTPDRVQHFIYQSVTLRCSGNNTEWRLRRFTEIGEISYTDCSNWRTMTGSSCTINSDRSHSGVYWCESGSDFSNTVNITVQDENNGIILVSPIQPVTAGNPVILSCRDEEQKLSNVFFYHNNKLIQNDSREELKISAVSKSDEGFYKCEHSGKESPQSWMAIRDKPQPVLSVSPSWLSPGASVTLSCGGLEHPSAGWRFFWYKVVPAKSSSSYSFELLTGRTSWTEQNSYLINGQNHTAGYVCRARRGEPVFYTKYSEAKFVWSADSHPAASLSVTPDRVQHFIYQSVTLSCSGNNTEWRLRRFTQTGGLSDIHCSNWGTMTGSSCTINTVWSHSGVYWCESGSGDFSNAVNITVQDKYYSIILVSPVHPVTEGDPVTLSCRDKEQRLLSNVFFYHNNKLIHNDSREEMKISAVSKSDEGFYKCEHSGNESPQSWMAVRVSLSSPVDSSFVVLMIVGPFIGIILIFLLLLLWCYKRSKDFCCIRSESSSQSPTINHGVNQTDSQVYSSLLHGDVEYESFHRATIKGSPDDPDEDPVYTNIEAKTTGSPDDPDEDPVYTNIEAETTGM